MSARLRSISPADPSDVVGEFDVAGDGEVAAAVARARAAFPAWRDAGFDTRAALLRRFAERAAECADDLARLLSREVGKALWDAQREAALVPAKVEITLDSGMEAVAPIVAGPGASATYHPRGVLAVLGPFNFPAHLPNGHIVPALAMGNTVVLKPSELAPASGAWLLARLREVGLPDGVVEIVQGGADTGRALAAHAGVDGVLFTGSWRAGRALREATLDEPGKLLALEMGGKNAIAVLADADLDLAASETAISICATTGQRCTCASRIFVAREVEDEFTTRLVRILRGVHVGAPLDPGVFMGPLVSQSAFDKLANFRALAREAGAERLLLVEPDLPAPWVGPGLVRFATVEQTHPYQREEIFGPEAAIYPVDGLDEAIAAVNDTDYGLAAAFFTRDRASWEHCAGRVRTGILNWNRGTVGASGKLPFGGRGRSGNDRPAGVSASVYCSVAQARLENEAGFDPDALPPGMPRP